jgi:malate/lactate dehydrogenase
VNHGTVNGKPIREVLADSSEWLDGEFITVVQQRGAAIIKVCHTIGGASLVSAFQSIVLINCDAASAIDQLTITSVAVQAWQCRPSE